jgi:protein-disulfide isomerase
MLLNVRRPMRSIAAASLLVFIGACDSGAPSNAAANGESAPAGGAATARQDWTKTMTATADGGFLMGNPNAKVKILEFASLSCSHCADFHEASKISLANYVRTGDVSYELRTFLLGGPLDPPVSLAVRCQGAAPFFRLIDDVFRTQKSWMQTAFDNQSKFAELQGQPQDEQLLGILRIAGLDSFFAARGLPASKLKQCMADTKQIDLLGKIRNDAVTQYGLTGTPTIAMNGETLEGVDTWAELEPKIKAAL